MITDETLLNEIKTRLLITGNYHDNVLLAFANDVKAYLHAAGIPAEIVDSGASVGVIAKGVSDLWNRGLEDGILSGFFMQRVAQMSFTEWGALDTSGEPATLIPISNQELDECTECLDRPSGSSGEQLIMSAMTEEEINACIECLKD